MPCNQDLAISNCCIAGPACPEYLFQGSTCPPFFRRGIRWLFEKIYFFEMALNIQEYEESSCCFLLDWQVLFWFAAMGRQAPQQVQGLWSASIAGPAWPVRQVYSGICQRLARIYIK